MLVFYYILAVLNIIYLFSSLKFALCCPSCAKEHSLSWSIAVILLSVSLNVIISFFELGVAREGCEEHTECCGWYIMNTCGVREIFFVLFFISYRDPNVSFHLFLSSVEQ